MTTKEKSITILYLLGMAAFGLVTFGIFYTLNLT